MRKTRYTYAETMWRKIAPCLELAGGGKAPLCLALLEQRCWPAWVVICFGTYPAGRALGCPSPASHCPAAQELGAICGMAQSSCCV